MTDPGPTVNLTQSDLVLLHSPLSLLAQFVLLLEDRFSQGNLPWKFDRDDNQTDIFIHTVYNGEREIKNAIPRIVVGRGTIVHRRASAGDMGPDQPELLTKEGYHHWGLGDVDVQIRCISENRGEASIIGDIVQTLIGMSRKEICKQFTLRDISNIALQPTRPWKRDKEKWEAAVQFRVNFEHQWITVPVAPKLREIKLYSKNKLDALDYVKTHVLRSQDLPAPE